MKWHPMETAPKDGTNILLALHPEISEKKGTPVAVMHYEKRPILGETWTAPGWDWSCDLGSAIGWMPLSDLPPPPVASSAGLPP